MFSSSYVLSERLKFLENEVQQQRIQLRSVVAERDNLQEDIFQIQTIRKQLDKASQNQKMLYATTRQHHGAYNMAVSMTWHKCRTMPSQQSVSCMQVQRDAHDCDSRTCTRARM